MTCKTTLQRIVAVAEVNFSFNRSLKRWFPVSSLLWSTTVQIATLFSDQLQNENIARIQVSKDINERCKQSRRQQSS